MQIDINNIKIFFGDNIKNLEYNFEINFNNKIGSLNNNFNKTYIEFQN